MNLNMDEDVEMNELKVPFINSDLSAEESFPEVEIKYPNGCEVKEELKTGNEVKFYIEKEGFNGLTKEELKEFANDPFWVKLRLVLFIVFWMIWLGMLIAAILIVVFSPKCPIRPKLDFWEKETGYWVDTMAFADSNNDGVGDIEGLITKFDYIQKDVGAGYIVLENIFAGQYSNEEKVIGLVNSFRKMDSKVGKRESFKKLMKESRRRGLEIVLTADFNSLSRSSDFIKNNSETLMKWDPGMNTWLSRDGKPSKRTYNSETVYSSSSELSSMIDLDLRKETVLKEIKESVKMWLDLGVRGFLLTNVAFYVENTSIPSQDIYKSNASNWYKSKSKFGQIFNKDTLEFFRQIRAVMNDVTKRTDKSRLLIVESGNVGYGLTQSTDGDEMLQYVNGDEKIVDLVISREFLRNRGWNFNNIMYSKSSVRNYLTMVKGNMTKKVALASATSTSLRTNELQKLAAPFLLPGNPIIYFGSEIGTECNTSVINSIKTSFYPGDHRFPLDDVEGEWPTRCNHMIMPWDNSGRGFSNGKMNKTDKYIKDAEATVQDLTAIGRGETILQLHHKLIKVREEPSLQWGSTEIFPSQEIDSDNYEIFIRAAKGFPKIIVALANGDKPGKVFSFSIVCEKVIPILVYPSNDNLPENQEINTDNIFLRNHPEGSVHVFKCSS